MKRLWLLFAQVVTVLLALYFVVATLQPSWLQRNNAVRSNAGVALIEAPQSEANRSAVATSRLSIAGSGRPASASKHPQR